MKKDYDDITEKYGSVMTEAQIRRIVQRYDWASKLSAGRRTIDLCAGYGLHADNIIQNSYSLTLVDISKLAVDHLTQKAQHYKQVEVIQANAEELQFPDNSFDLILLFDCIYYIHDQEGLLEKIVRWLAPNGKILISTVNVEHFRFIPGIYTTSYPDANFFKQIADRLGVYCKLTYSDYTSCSRRLSKIIRFILRSLNWCGLYPHTIKSKSRIKAVLNPLIRCRNFFISKASSTKELDKNEQPNDRLLHRVLFVELTK